MHFFETSAKQDINVEKSFLTIAKDIKKRLIANGDIDGTQGYKLHVKPGNGTAPARSSCCKQTDERANGIGIVSSAFAWGNFIRIWTKLRT